MPQLIMRWKNDGKKPNDIIFPQNITLKNWKDIDNPIEKWLDIVQYGLSPKREDEAYYRLANSHYKYYKPEDCYFFLLNNEEVATVTIICDPEKKEGYIHMVAAKPQARGIGIGNLMSYFAVKILKEQNMETAFLTTDDFRLPAIKTYLNGGFYPDVSTEDFKQRWDKIYEQLNIK